MVLVANFLSKTAAWLGVGDVGVDLCPSNHDAFDALVAALVARAAALGQVEPIPPDDRAAAAASAPQGDRARACGLSRVSAQAGRGNLATCTYRALAAGPLHHLTQRSTSRRS